MDQIIGSALDFLFMNDMAHGKEKEPTGQQGIAEEEHHPPPAAAEHEQENMLPREPIGLYPLNNLPATELNEMPDFDWVKWFLASCGGEQPSSSSGSSLPTFAVPTLQMSPMYRRQHEKDMRQQLRSVRNEQKLVQIRLRNNRKMWANMKRLEKLEHAKDEIEDTEMVDGEKAEFKQFDAFATVSSLLDQAKWKDLEESTSSKKAEGDFDEPLASTSDAADEPLDLSLKGAAVMEPTEPQVPVDLDKSMEERILLHDKLMKALLSTVEEIIESSYRQEPKVEEMLERLKELYKAGDIEEVRGLVPAYIKEKHKSMIHKIMYNLCIQLGRHFFPACWTDLLPMPVRNSVISLVYCALKLGDQYPFLKDLLAVLFEKYGEQFKEIVAKDDLAVAARVRSDLYWIINTEDLPQSFLDGALYQVAASVGMGDEFDPDDYNPAEDGTLDTKLISILEDIECKAKIELDKVTQLLEGYSDKFEEALKNYRYGEARHLAILILKDSSGDYALPYLIEQCEELRAVVEDAMVEPEIPFKSRLDKNLSQVVTLTYCAQFRHFMVEYEDLIMGIYGPAFVEKARRNGLDDAKVNVLLIGAFNLPEPSEKNISQLCWLKSAELDVDYHETTVWERRKLLLMSLFNPDKSQMQNL